MVLRTARQPEGVWLLHRPLWAALLLQVMLLPAEAKPKKYPQHHTSKVHWKKENECARGECSGFHTDENEDCCAKCVSATCHEEVYGSDPLEPGEVDRVRQTRFNACVKKEQDEEAKRQAEERKAARSR
eukprot:TRINITY_DN13364_c0_g1_i1.p1 TRINITY_DN13364_c0_g1~~TRINITY_DN13364_c0_g1_i1.p1  ORF type:complete len:129 (-),score=28.99 TRINITY_DN13364_c0_g1_i1:41-427(-)